MFRTIYFRKGTFSLITSLEKKNRYAEPPKRWKKAESIVRKDGVLIANETGKDCWGNEVPGTNASHMSESCLTLDIYVPKKTRDAAVMVYLHGGSLVEGSSTAIQSGYFAVSNMTRENVISVSVNYRVAILGFLSVEALTDPSKKFPEANFGLFDVIEALRWIQDNIIQFGGDPSRVTVYGQSSGGTYLRTYNND